MALSLHSDYSTMLGGHTKPLAETGDWSERYKMGNGTRAYLSKQILNGKPRKFGIAEAGYCVATTHEYNLKEQDLQHMHLQDALSAYPCNIVRVSTVPEFYGTVFTTSALFLHAVKTGPFEKC